VGRRSRFIFPIWIYLDTLELEVESLSFFSGNRQKQKHSFCHILITATTTSDSTLLNKRQFAAIVTYKPIFGNPF